VFVFGCGADVDIEVALSLGVCLTFVMRVVLQELVKGVGVD
jgi:hypothetical protein